MANFASLKATIDAQIKANGNQEITGPILNAVLTAMINTIGNGYALQGTVAQTTDNPGSPDNPVAYIAAGPGTYTNFGATVIPDDGHAYLLTWDTSWHAVQLPLPTFNLANGKQDALTFDNVPTLGSDNPVKSDGIAQELDDKQDKDTGDTAGHVAVMDGNGNSEDGGVPLADLATKAEVAVLAGEAGLAEAVIDTDGAGTEQEFTFRKSGGDGGAYYRKIKGKTIAWNQLAVDSPIVSGVTVTHNSDGSYTINGTSNSPWSSVFFVPPTSGEVGHKIFLRLIKISGSVTPVSSVSLIDGDEAGAISLDGGANVYTKTSDNLEIGIYGSAGDVYNNYRCFVQVVDLTLAGVADEISTAADFLALYPNPIPYTPGTLISNDADAVETTGVNQWDEEWESGVWDINTGESGVGTDQIRCKNFIEVMGGSVLYFKTPVYVWVLEYDANFNYLHLYQTTINSTITLNANTRYIKFYTLIYGTTYNHDICINISNPAINGQYFPYWKRTLQLGLTTKEDTDGNVPFADGMKGAGTAADWADKVGGEKRMGRVDLGDLEWTYSDVYLGFFASPDGAKKYFQAICSKYPYVGAYTVVGDKQCGFIYNTGIFIKDSDYGTDPAAFKAAMQGVMLDYELATPVPFTWAEPLNLGVKVDENGTERAVQPAGATEPSAPFTAMTTYTMSIARMVAILQGI